MATVASAAAAAGSVDASASAQRVVLFDFDGVLLRGDAFHLFVRQRYVRAPWRGLLVLACLPVLLIQVVLSRLTAGRTLSRIALLGVREPRYQSLVNAFAARLVRHSRMCCRDGLRALRQHLAAGDHVVVVTGCEQRLVSAIFRELGLAEVDILAAQWCDRWFGLHLTRPNVGVRKVQLLARHGLTAWQVAYSDSLRDVPMLRLAAEAVLVNATPARCKQLEKALGRAVTRVHWY